jgi:DNA repair protein SbcD/Mre11
MKIIHFADCHVDVGSSLGMIDPITRLPGRVMDSLEMLDCIVDFAKDENVDLIIFAGDAFHRHNPLSAYINEFSKRILAMSNICPVVILVGNHDMSPVSSAVEYFDSLQVHNVTVGNDYRVHKITTASGIIQVATAPYPSRKLLLDDKKKDLNTELHNRIYALGDEVTDDAPAILVGHFTVEGSQYGAEREYAVGSDATVKLSLLADPVWDYVALGHIHYHQCLNDSPPVVYSGSTDRVTFGEEHEDKGFVLIEIDEDRNTKWEFITLDARPYITLDISTLSKDPMSKLMKRIEDLDMTGAVVRVIIKVRSQYTQNVDKRLIIDLLGKKKIYLLTSLVIRPIKNEVDSQSRMDTEVFNVSMTQEELLTAYLANISIASKDMQGILGVAKDIMGEINGKGN